MSKFSQSLGKTLYWPKSGCSRSAQVQISTAGAISPCTTHIGMLGADKPPSAFRVVLRLSQVFAVRFWLDSLLSKDVQRMCKPLLPLNVGPIICGKLRVPIMIGLQLFIQGACSQIPTSLSLRTVSRISELMVNRSSSEFHGSGIC